MTGVAVIITLTALAVFVEFWPWPDAIRQPSGQPWVLWDRDYDLGMTPDDWDALETLLADEESLAEAEAAEQEARQSMNGCYIPLTDEGEPTDEHEH